MSENDRHGRLIDELASGLAPVHRLPPPGVRALIWCMAVVALGLILFFLRGTEGLSARLGVADICYAALGTVLTAVAAALAAFETSVPDRSATWALLPLPPLYFGWGLVGSDACAIGSRRPLIFPARRPCAAVSYS